MSFSASRYVKHLIQAPNGEALSVAEKLILSLLADDHNEDERCAWPSVGQLAARACMTERYCRMLLRKLETSGVLESTPRLRENGGRSSSGYRFPQIDPPFEAKKVAHTRKLMQLQAAKRISRPVQQSLEIHRIHSDPPDPQFRGGRKHSSGGGGTGMPGGAEPENRGRGNSASGGKELPLEALGQPVLDSGADLDGLSPTPPLEGCKPTKADHSAWNLLKVRIKSALSSVPRNVGRRFSPVKEGECDYDACFRDWWLVGRRDQGHTVVIETGATDEAATLAGIEKYGARLEREARRTFPRTAGKKIEFVVATGAVVDIAAAAE